jgi:putative transposase
MPLAFFVQLLSRPLAWLEQLYLRWTWLPPSSAVCGLSFDLTRSKSELVLENALLRHQLAILKRQSKPPHFTSADRFWFLLIASRLLQWKDALILLKPETLLRWHREGLRLCWKRKSKPKTTCPKIREDHYVDSADGTRQSVMGCGADPWRTPKLGIRVAKRTIQRRLRWIKPPREPNQTWSTFLHNHANDIWACDFCPSSISYFACSLSFTSLNLPLAVSCILE